MKRALPRIVYLWRLTNLPSLETSLVPTEVQRPALFFVKPLGFEEEVNNLLSDFTGFIMPICSGFLFWWIQSPVHRFSLTELWHFFSCFKSRSLYFWDNTRRADAEKQCLWSHTHLLAFSMKISMTAKERHWYLSRFECAFEHWRRLKTRKKRKNRTGLLCLFAVKRHHKAESWQWVEFKLMHTNDGIKANSHLKIKTHF